jgi:preprotein translocase subunit SecA
VQIVDESTGRVMVDRSWEQGLRQLIETKEGVKLTAGRDTLARKTFQRLFRRHDLLAGLTGTTTEAARELWSTYRLRARRLPAAANASIKWRSVTDDAIAAAARG